MILEHSNTAPIQCTSETRSCCSHGTESLRKIQHSELTLPTGLLFLGQWHNIWEVTNSTGRLAHEPNFCHDNCKNIAKMRQVCQGAVGLCKKIVTTQWKDCASIYVVVTIIQSMSMTQGISLLEQSYLSFHCHIRCFISWSSVKFPCGMILVELWNSSYVVLMIKLCIYIKMVCSSVFWDII
jgi:hypothetical protein